MVKDIHMDSNQLEFRAMNTEEKIIWRTEQYRVPDSLPKEEAFHALMNRTANGNLKERKRVVKLPVRYFYAAAAAAIILLIAGTWFVWNSRSVENVIAEKGHQTDYKLPDGSVVSLNADTRISFNKARFDKKRMVKMEGEAFFNIEKGSPFTIATSLADIKILGTSFNVYARDNSFRVNCFSGKIMVTKGSRTVVVNPMETARIENDILSVVKEENVYASAGWRNGEFNFENTPLNLVFDEIERQYNITFILPGLKGKYFTGSITNNNLVNALDIVCIPMGLTYEIGSNSKVFIKLKTE
jgi:transmembrane sensor